MCAVKSDHDHKPSLIGSILGNKCSRCRRGDLYKYRNPYRLKHFMKMYDSCPVCGQQYEIEVGFFYGTGFVSYALSVALCVATFISWKVLIGMSLHDNRIFWWMGINGIILVLVQPLLMRFSRTIWLCFFVWYAPNWKEAGAKAPERTTLSLKNDW